MTLSNGRHYLAIPGPSVAPEEVLRAMHRPSPNIYEGELVEMVHALIPDLRALARTRHQAAIYIANGHGAWEAAVSNVLGRGEKVLVAASGRFAHGWAEMAARMGARPEILDFGLRAPIDPARVGEALAADTGHEIRAVMAVHVDTSTSARSDIAALRRAIDEAGHPALLMVDCIASLACERFEMDAWGVDVMVAGSQKGLMVPPGLAFVFFNDRAEAARERCDNVTAYWDWRPRARPRDFYQYFGGTAPTHHLYGLRCALDMIAAEGLENVWRRHEVLARAWWAAFETWGRNGPLELNIAERAARSHAVTALRITPPLGTALREWLSENTGVTLGIGLGMAPSDDPARHGFFRVGHMGHVNAHMVLGAIGALEAGLKALKIPHGWGALEDAAEVVAGL